MNDTNQTAATDTPGPFRFSILTLLGVMAALALVVALLAMIGERTRWKTQTVVLREELRQLRETNQLLDVVDPEKIYIRGMIAPFERMGQWQVHLPEGSDYRLKYDWQDLPPDRDPTNVSRPYPGMKLPPGTYTISQTFQFAPSRNKSEWSTNVTASKSGFGGRINHGFPTDAPSWLTSYKVSENEFELPSTSQGKPAREFSFRTTGPQANAPQQAFNPDDDVSLIEYEVYDPRAPNQSSGDLLPQKVFRLWIEKEPQKP